MTNTLKSSEEQLKGRGYVTDGDIEKYTGLNENDLVQLLHNKEAYKRTIGIRLLSAYKKEKYIPLFCGLLKTEKKLYTKIALCDSLIQYDEKAIPYLLPLIGTIGNNRHTKIAAADIHKKSYPLPRDIAGRILIRIGPAVFPELEKIITENTNTSQVYEAIDVIGHIAWNYRDYRLEKALIGVYNKNQNDEFLEWKIIRAFQSFNSPEVKTILEKTRRTGRNKILAEEAKRSLMRIEGRTQAR
jgi:hypothetical protein